MKKLLFIFNEKSGRAQLKERLYSIVNFYQENNFIVTLLPIKQINCFSELLETSTVDVLVCAGGDGTLNSVLSQYMKLGCKMPVGYLPMGSTNDYARTLGYTDDFEKALQRSCLGVARTVDIGRFNDQYFVYVAAFGSLTEVSYSTSQPMKNILGHFAYILSGIQKITDIRFYHLKLHNQDQQIEGRHRVTASRLRSSSPWGIRPISRQAADSTTMGTSICHPASWTEPSGMAGALCRGDHARTAIWNI